MPANSSNSSSSSVLVSSGAEAVGQTGKNVLELDGAIMRKERVANNAWHKFCRNKSAVVGLVIVSVMILIGIFAPLIATHNPNELDPVNAFKKPLVDGFIFGADELGRDLFSRILYGARMSVLIALSSTVLGATLGICIGLLVGYAGGIVDSIFMRIMDGMFAFPNILLAILLMTIFGPGALNVILAISIGTVPSFSRVVRGQVLIAKNEEYCDAEKILGASHLRIMLSHILPNTISSIIVVSTLHIGSAIITEASLSFLGLGILIPTASWGNILRAGRQAMISAPHISIIPGVFIFVTVIGFNLVGEGIRDIFDAKMKR